MNEHERYFALRRVLTRTQAALDHKANQCRKAIRASGRTMRFGREVDWLVLREQDYRTRSLIVWDLRLNERMIAKLVKSEGVPDDTRRG